MDKKWIWLDMDGTIANLYSVKNWKEDLDNLNERPYRVAKSLYNDIDLLAILGQLKIKKGYNIGIITWGSRDADEDFLKRIAETKKAWLNARGYDMLLDVLLVVRYGTDKASICKEYGCGILVDDEKRNLDAWNLGKTINAQFSILSQLEALL